MRHRMIHQVMTENVVAVDRNTAFKDIVTALAGNGISAVPVIDADRRVLGVVSEADLLAKECEVGRDRSGWPPRLLVGRRRQTRVKSAATRAYELMTAPAITVGAELDVAVAARLLDEHRVKRLPVVDAEGRLVGIVSRRDLLRVFLRTDKDIAEEITQDILRRAMCTQPGAVGVDVIDGVAILRGEVERRSMVPITAALTHRVDGVVDVINHLTYAQDDSKPPAPTPENYGVLHELRHLP